MTAEPPGFPRKSPPSGPATGKLRGNQGQRSGARVGWLDLGSGVSGDMLLGALHQLGALDPVPAWLDALGIPGVTLSAERVERAGLAATRVHIDAPAGQPLRTLREVREVLERADLPGTVRARALAVFERLARAEGTVHGIDPGQVHFHEVGAVDALVDVVGGCVGLAALGLDALHGTPVALGGGTVAAGHGMLPVPGPAVLALLAEAGVPAHGGPVEVELATPTGTALVAEHVGAWGPMPAMTVEQVGTGAGTRELPGRPNLLRLVVGTASEQAAAGAEPPSEPALLIEANVDDLDPRLWPGVLTRLLAAGASDAWLVPMLMKKGRPAHTLRVLLPDRAELAATVRRIVFCETTTIGLREHVVAKRALPRREQLLQMAGRPVRVKVAYLDGQPVNVAPEHDDVAAVALATGRPVRDVLAEATALARAATGD